MRRSRALFLCAVACIGLSACSSSGGDEWLAMYKLVRDSWGSSENNVDLDRAAAIPYATLGVRIDDGPEQILVLATDQNSERLWVSSSRVVLKIRNGRVVSTAGLGHNLTSLLDTASGTDWKKPRHSEFVADFAEDGIYAVRIACNSAPAGEEQITILGAKFDTLRVDELCESKQLDWSFSNTYWVSRTSQRVWQSVQYFHPKAAPLQIELLRPPVTED